MSSHELAQRLLLMPDLPVMARDIIAFREVGCYTRILTKDDSDDHADCEGRAGETIIVL